MVPQERPVGTVSVRETVPLKLLTELIVRMVMAVAPTFAAGGFVAVRVKSG